MLTDTLAALTRLEVVRTDPSVGTFPMLSSFCIPNTLLGELWGQWLQQLPLPLQLRFLLRRGARQGVVSGLHTRHL